MKVLNQLRLPVDAEDQLYPTVARALGVRVEALALVRVRKRALDARHKQRLQYVYTVEVWLKGEVLPGEDPGLPPVAWRGDRPVIIGAGPGGLFAALRLLDQGVPSIVLERGAEVHPRTVKINMFWKKGWLDPESNVCFGEGGAGLFSDGKLITRIRSPHIPYVLKRLVDFGAPPEITWVSNPHVGSDKLRRVIKALVSHLQASGCEIHFNTRMERLMLDSTHRVTGVTLADGRALSTHHVILATGHSARDLYQTLHAQGVRLQAKAFAMGLRIEHPQKLINLSQLGLPDPGPLGAAAYRLTWNAEGSALYSFCMCPGGYVLSSGTEPDGVVVNGMSNYRRSSRWANSALVVPMQPRAGETDPFHLAREQQALEHAAWKAVQEVGGGHRLPAQRVEDFLAGRRSSDLPEVSSPSGAVSVALGGLLPEPMRLGLQQGLEHFGRRIPGFVGNEGVLMGVESRTSSPIRIPRDEGTLESENTPGLYPVGEGAGYAGGITSAAVDGIRAALAVLGAHPDSDV